MHKKKSEAARYQSGVDTVLDNIFQTYSIECSNAASRNLNLPFKNYTILCLKKKCAIASLGCV